MAVPVTVLNIGPEDGDVLVAEWYQPDGAAVRKGEPVYRLETDFVAVEVEAEENGVLRHAVEAGSRQRNGKVVAFITAEGELLPGEDPPSPAPTEPRVPKPKPRGDRRGVYPLAEVLKAAANEITASDAANDSENMAWEPGPAPGEGSDAARPHAPLLLFPHIVEALKEEADLQAELEPETPELAMADEPEPPTRMKASAWDLVPGENDFNPDWIMERNDLEAEDEPRPGRGRFQASSIRSLALGREEAAPAAADLGSVALDIVAEAETEPLATISESQSLPVDAGPPTGPQPSQARPRLDPFRRSTPAMAAPAPLPTAAPAAPPTVAPIPAPTIAPFRSPLELPNLERRADDVAGAPLFLRVTVDMDEAAKMRDQLTREWWGSNVRPTDEDIVLRAIARALHESAAFRRRADVVGMRPLAGGSRTVHLLGDAATRPFRDAVASLAALRETPGADIPCVSTLTSFAELDLDEAMPALPHAQPLAFAMGATRDVARFRGDQPYRAQVMALTMAYDSDAMPDGVAARLLSRVRELVEAPYALLAD